MSLTAAGYTRRRLPEIKTDIEDDFKSAFGSDIDLSPSEPIGQIIGVEAQIIADLEEALEAVYNSQYPDSAEGVSLARVCRLTGVMPLDASKTVIHGVVTGDQGTVLNVADNLKARLKEVHTEFDLVASVTIDRTAAVGIKLSVGTVANSTVYTITINGTAHSITSDADATAQEIITALAAKLVTDAAPVVATDNGDLTLSVVTDDYETSLSFLLSANLTLESVTCNAEFHASIAQYTYVPENTLIEIVTPVSGWDAVDNWFVGQTGRNEEIDSELRTRRDDSTRVVGKGNLEALRARLRQEVENVVGVYIIENRTGSTVDGRPPHSYECVISGGDEDEIAAKIWNVGSGGIEPVGTIVKNVVDSQGVTQVIRFSRPTNVYCWLNVSYTLYSEETFPTDGNAQIIAAILAYAEVNQNVGIDVILQRIAGYIILNVPGLKTVTLTIATSSTPEGPAGTYSGSDLAISQTQTAVFAEDRIAVS